MASVAERHVRHFSLPMKAHVLNLSAKHQTGAHACHFFVACTHITRHLWRGRGDGGCFRNYFKHFAHLHSWHFLRNILVLKDIILASLKWLCHFVFVQHDFIFAYILCIVYWDTLKTIINIIRHINKSWDPKTIPE